MGLESVFSTPRHVTDISDCYFYHVMDLPGYGEVGGEWDLRGGEESYLGRVSFAGKRVLELGTASGYLCRFMEGKGAEVIGFDLPRDRSWDLVPFATIDLPSARVGSMAHIERMKNGWWLAHRIFGSRAKAVYGNIYEIPKEIGPVDISTFGAILLHLRDPFQALYSALRLTRETAIITDLHPDQSVGPQDPNASPDSAAQSDGFLNGLRRYVGLRRYLKPWAMKTWPTPVVEHPGCELYFLPNPEVTDLRTAVGSWWSFPPEIISRFLGVLGFEDQVMTEHFQSYQGRKVRLYTVVGKRTVGSVD